jgi:2-succinyl-5-enolpyruvyl-6-hydroxy-3-cyclohexene-1-carboxylate synthase
VEDFERVYGTPTEVNLYKLFNNLSIESKEIKNIEELKDYMIKPSGIKVLIIKIASREKEAELRKELLIS